MGYPFFILSIYIIIFFLLCLTCFSLDYINSINLKDEGNFESETISSMPIEEEFEEITLNKNTNLPTLGNLRRCLTKEKVLNALKMIFGSFLLAGMCVDSSAKGTYILKKDQYSAMRTSVQHIAHIFVSYLSASLVLKFVVYDFVVATYYFVVFYILAAVVYICGEFGQYLLVRKLLAGKINTSNVLFTVTGFLRIMPIIALIFIHVFYTFICDMNSPTRNMWISVILASCVSLFFLICHVFIYYNYRKPSARSLFYMCSLLLSHALISFAQLETVLSVFLFFLSEDKPVASILLSMVCYIIISFLPFFQEKNGDFYLTNYEELQPLAQYIRMETMQKTSNNDNTSNTEEGRSRWINAEELCTHSIH